MSNGLLYALSKWGEFSQIRFRATLAAGEQRRIPIVVPAGKTYYIFTYKFGDITADVINFRFSGVLNYYEQNILIGTELLNFDVEPEPYIAVKGSSGAIVVENTDAVERDFSMVLDCILISDELAEGVRKDIIGNREVARGSFTGGA